MSSASEATPNSPTVQIEYETMTVAPKATTRPISGAAPAPAAAVISSPPPSVPAVKVDTPKAPVEVYFVKVKNGVAQIVGRAGKLLIYIETELSELGQSAKVWVLGMAEGVRSRAEPYLKPYLEKLASMYAEAKGRVGATVAPLYARVEGNVLYVQGKVGDYTIAFKAKLETSKSKISDAWTASVKKIDAKYAIVCKEAEIRLTPMLDWTKGKYNIAQEKIVSVTNPILMKAKDGSTYVQVQVGKTVVYIKTGLSDTYGRISDMSIATYNKAYKAVSHYTDPIIEKLVAMYQGLKMKILTKLEPFVAKAKRGMVDAKVAILDVTARVRARVVVAKEGTAKYLSECYIKIKNGFVYVQGRIGEILLSIKVRLEDLRSSVKVKMLTVRDEAQLRLAAATKYTKTKVAALDTRVRAITSDSSNQVTAASAVGGAAALGASGGASGLLAGGAIGAACGVVPAIFTFGLSIPIGAALGGATGLCVGTVTGGAVGLVGGGAAGRSAHKHKDEIKSGVACALTKADRYKDLVAEKTTGYKDLVAEKASGYKVYMAEKTGNVRARIVGGTGGTA